MLSLRKARLRACPRRVASCEYSDRASRNKRDIGVSIFPDRSPALPNQPRNKRFSFVYRFHPACLPRRITSSGNARSKGQAARKKPARETGLDLGNMVARDGVEPLTPAFFSVGLCCSLNDLRDSRWLPKSLKSRERRSDHGLKLRVQELEARAHDYPLESAFVVIESVFHFVILFLPAE
jgi:hypothetical protein